MYSKLALSNVHGYRALLTTGNADRCRFFGVELSSSGRQKMVETPVNDRKYGEFEDTTEAGANKHRKYRSLGIDIANNLLSKCGVSRLPFSIVE